MADNMFTFCPCPKTSQETEIKGNELINLTQEISRQPNIQAISDIFLAAFSQIYNEIQGQKGKQKNVQNLNFSTKGTLWKVGAKRGGC